MTAADNPFTASLIAALGVGVFEVFFHRYLANQVLPDQESNGNGTRNLRYQTEYAEEISEDRRRDK